MTADVTIKGGAQLEGASLARGDPERSARAAVHGGGDAVPAPAFRLPHRPRGGAGRPRRACRHSATERGLEPLKPGAKHHRLSLSGAVLRWEQHSEFTTYTWELPADGQTPFQPAATALAAPLTGLPQPGPVLVALDLHALAGGESSIAIERVFDRASVAVAENSEGDAVFATDFQLDPSGFVRILVLDRGLGPPRAGALVQRLIELETYRTLALLGLPEAQRLQPAINRIEQRLAEVTEEMTRTEKLIDNHRLLDELTALAAELEAGAAASLFRFGASRAYNEIVQLRLATIGERKVDNFPTWSSFLARRMQPAMRTCSPSRSGRRPYRRSCRAPPTCCARGSTLSSSSRTATC